MRLANFIDQNLEPILLQWESFARSLWRGTAPDPAALRDHAKEILCATVRDMRSGQTLAQQSDKSKGKQNHGAAESEDVDAASNLHAAARLDSGFYLPEVVAEYRALRASVLRLWQESEPTADMQDLEDLTRFNESIDQSLTKGINAYAVRAERNRVLLADEQAARAGAEAENRAKDIFLATLSHEMRTPLTAIVGWAHVLGSGTCSKADMQRGAEVIKRNAEAQARMIDEVLDVSRIVSGKLQLEIVESDLIVLIGAAIDAMRAAADAKNITLTAELDPAARTAAVDPDRIQQVVWNVLSNAVKFTPTGGRVNISLSSEGRARVIRIVDTGIGIEPRFLPHVFQRFWQVDNGSRRQFPGLGLGLSIVKHLVELHGGVIEASSAGPGRGSAFTTRLPVSHSLVQTREIDEAGVASAATGVDSDVRNEPEALDGLRVLLVEDEVDTRDILVRLLGAAGAIVLAVSSAAEAMDSLSHGAGNVDVLVSDLGMPGQDGFDLIREVRDRGYDAEALPAIALTAFVGIPDQRRALDAGFQAHVTKPVDPHALTAAIASLLGRSVYQ
jgi:signal transduction histidine kinase